MLYLITDPLQFTFMQKALVANLFLSISCSLVGTYVVLRRMSFMSEALSHTILPGVAFAYIKQFELLWGAFCASILTALGIGYLSSNKDIREDTAIGVMLSFMFSLGVLMMHTLNSYQDFTHILFGSILTITNFELKLSGYISLFVTIIIILIQKELAITSYDSDYSSIIGIRPKTVKYILLILIAFSVVSTVQIIGTLLTTALLVIPPATACLWVKSVNKVMFVSILLANLSGILGLYCAFYFNLPSGASIVLWASIFFCISWIVHQIRKSTKYC